MSDVSGCVVLSDWRVRSEEADRAAEGGWYGGSAVDGRGACDGREAVEGREREGGMVAARYGRLCWRLLSVGLCGSELLWQL